MGESRLDMKVFLSYGRSSEEATRRLRGCLETADCRVWMDHSVTGGHEWWERILAEIRECDVFGACGAAA